VGARGSGTLLGTRAGAGPPGAMYEDDCRLLVEKMPLDVTEDEIREVFSLYGTIADINVNMHVAGLPERRAYVRFDVAQEASAAMVVLNDMYKFREGRNPISVKPASHGDANSRVRSVGAPPAAGATPVGAPPPSNAVTPVVCEWNGAPPVPQPNGKGGAPVGGAKMESKGSTSPAPPVGGYTSCVDGGSFGSQTPAGAKLWVGNLPGDITSEALEKVFASYGQVSEISVMPVKARSGQACAFVNYKLPQHAEACLTAMAFGYEIRPGEGPIKVERPSDRKGKGKGGWHCGEKGGDTRYRPY